jgi:hypothetical protein
MASDRCLKEFVPLLKFIQVDRRSSGSVQRFLGVVTTLPMPHTVSM